MWQYWSACSMRYTIIQEDLPDGSTLIRMPDLHHCTILTPFQNEINVRIRHAITFYTQRAAFRKRFQYPLWLPSENPLKPTLRRRK